MNYDVAVVGAGIVGAACADSLAGENVRVVVIEAAPAIASGATAAAMGHIVVMDDSEAQFALTDYSRKLWNELVSELPKRSEYEFCGTIWIAADAEEMEAVRRKFEFYQKRNVRCEILDEKSLREAEPNLRENLAGGLLVPDDSVVYQPCAAQFLIDRAIENGAQIRLGKRVVAVSGDTVKLENGELIEAKKIINAAGIGATALDENLPIVKRKGHLIITERRPKFVAHQLIELGYLKSAHESRADSVAFNVQPRMTGQMLLGSSRQFDVEDQAVDYEIVRRMCRRAFEYMPALRDCPAIRVWTGFRPATPDNLPYIGQSANRRNVYLAAGHEGLGITTALGTARILTDLILDRPPRIACEAFSPARFA